VSTVVVLDSLFESLDVEREAAARYGAQVVRVQDEPSLLASAEVVAHVRTRVDAELIAAMPACRVIARFGTGLDTVDLDAAKRAGIAVVGVRDYCIPELTSHTLALAFALTRRIQELEGLEAGWDEVVASVPLRGRRRAAVVGLGSVGAAVASALVAMRFDVLAVTSRSDAARTVGAVPATLEHALEAADLVLLHLALTEETAGLLDRRRLALMPPGAILVNTARLALLDEHAVAEALEEGRLGGLGLDARLAPGSPLARLRSDPRVIVTPHVGWYSEASARSLRERAIGDALEHALRPRPEEAGIR
jgi:D-3-phosphoglycerate dehydrogenase